MPDDCKGIPTFLKTWLSSQNPIPSAHQLTEQFNIKIHISNDSPKLGNLVLRAEYSGNPPTITVYRKSLEQWVHQLIDKDSTPSLSLEHLIEICIFHEFIHHLFRYPDGFFPKEYSKQLKKLKRAQEEIIVRNIVQEWLSRRFPEYNTQVENILGK